MSTVAVRAYDDIRRVIGGWRRNIQNCHPDPTAEFTCCVIEMLATEIIDSYRNRQPTKDESAGVHMLYRMFDHVWDKGLQ